MPAKTPFQVLAAANKKNNQEVVVVHHHHYYFHGENDKKKDNAMVLPYGPEPEWPNDVQRDHEIEFRDENGKLLDKKDKDVQKYEKELRKPFVSQKFDIKKYTKVHLAVNAPASVAIAARAGGNKYAGLI